LTNACRIEGLKVNDPGIDGQGSIRQIKAASGHKALAQREKMAQNDWRKE